MLDPGVLFIRVGHRVLVRPVGGNLRGQLLGNHFLDLVLVLPLDVAEPVIELPNDVREGLHLRFRLLPAAACGGRLDLGVLVGKLNVARRLLLHPIAVHVDGLENPL